MIRNRKPKVLLGIPTYAGKNYCLRRFLDGIDALNKDGFQVRVLFVDNTADGGANAKMIGALSGYTCHHLDLRHLNTTNERLAESHNYLRDAAISLKADYLFHVESDLLLEPMTLHELYLLDAPLATSLYCIGTGSARYPLAGMVSSLVPRGLPTIMDVPWQYEYRQILKAEIGTAMCVGVGVMLMRKDALELLPFVGDSNAHAAPDTRWSADAANVGFFPKFNARVLAHHMNDLGWGAEHHFSSDKQALDSYSKLNFHEKH